MHHCTFTLEFPLACNVLIQTNAAYINRISHFGCASAMVPLPILAVCVTVHTPFFGEHVHKIIRERVQNIKLTIKYQQSSQILIIIVMLKYTLGSLLGRDK